MFKQKQSTDPSGPRPRRRWIRVLLLVVVGLAVWQIAAWLTPIPAPLVSATVITDNLYDAFYSSEITARADSLPAEVNILLVGLDNRLASHDNHADAIHLITVRTRDSVGVTIHSIPRGTPVTGYNIADDLSFMANVRALRGRKTFMGAVADLAGKKRIDYYVEVTFSQVMGVLELLGYKDPATALQFLRHRKTYRLGDVQRSYNQGKFIMTQASRRGDLLTGAKGNLLIRMGLGMVDTDLDLETVQALIYTLKKHDALDAEHFRVELLPHAAYSALEDVETPEPNDVGEVVNKLVHRTGDMIDDLGRYDPYPKLQEIVSKAESQRKPKGVLAVIQPIYEQKAWLQLQERPRRREIRNRVERLLVNAYSALNQPEKATAVRQYMVEERKAFSEVEQEGRQFTYGRRYVKAKSETVDTAAMKRAEEDEIGQHQTLVSPQEEHTPDTSTEQSPDAEAEPHVEDLSTPSQQSKSGPDQGAEPRVHNIDTSKQP